MRGFFGVAALALTLMAVPVGAADWVKVTEDDDGMVVLLDVESTRRSEPVRTIREFPVIQAWVKYDLKKVRSERFRERLILTSVDCIHRKAAPLTMLHYLPGGKLAESHHFEDESSRYIPIAPATLGEVIAMAICGVGSR